MYEKVFNNGSMELLPEKYRSLSAEEVQKIGQQHYRSKNYQEALEAFTIVSGNSDDMRKQS